MDLVTLLQAAIITHNLTETNHPNTRESTKNLEKLPQNLDHFGQSFSSLSIGIMSKENAKQISN